MLEYAAANSKGRSKTREIVAKLRRGAGKQGCQECAGLGEMAGQALLFIRKNAKKEREEDGGERYGGAGGGAKR